MSIASETKQGMQITTFLLVGLILVFSIMFHNTGGIAGLVRLMGVIASIWAVRRPQVGMVLLGFFCFYLDFVKKLAVTFGAQSMSTVMEVLAIQMLVLGCTIMGTLIQLLLIDRRFQRVHLYAFGFTAAVTGLSLALTARYGMVSAIQTSVNGGLYSGLMVVMLAFYHTRESVIKYLDYIFFLAIPWAIYGSLQYYIGFADFEWEYARTWFSAISSANMFSIEGPRPVGFGSGPQGYGVLTQVLNYGLWRTFLRGRINGGFMLGCAVLWFGLFCSLQRTILVQPLIFLMVFWAFKKTWSTKLLYSSGFVLFVIGVISSSFLLSNLESTTSRIQGESGWSSKVLNVNTFSDRLVGWKRLTRASTYTLIGNRITKGISDDERRSGGDEYSHDMINTILDEGGLLGLAFAIGVPYLVLSRIHRTIWEIEDLETQGLIICLLGTTMIQFGLAAVAGSNLATVPHNFVNWAFFGAAVTLTVQHRKILIPLVVRESNEPLATYGKKKIPFTRSGSARG